MDPCLALGRHRGRIGLRDDRGGGEQRLRAPL